MNIFERNQASFTNIQKVVGFDTGTKDLTYNISDEEYTSMVVPIISKVVGSNALTEAKIPIHDSQILNSVQNLFEHKKTEEKDGGTTPNIFYSLNEVTRQSVDLNLVGIGSDALANLKERGVKIHLDDKSASPPVSVILYVGDSNEKRTLVNPGDFKQVITNHLSEADVFSSNSFYLLTGSVYGKIGENNYNKIVDMVAQQENHTVDFCIPTDKKLANDNREYFINMSSKATLVVGNIEELSHLYKIDFKEDQHFATGEPSEDLKRNLKAFQGNLQSDAHGLITAGKYGCFLITNDDLEFVRNTQEMKKPFVNGAGDTTIGSYIGALKLGYSPFESANISMSVAFEKLKYNQARLPDISNHFENAVNKLGYDAPDIICSKHIQFNQEIAHAR